MHKELPLTIYNRDTDVTRLVRITPDRDWPGEGSLGCGVGFGYLHRLPAPLKASPTAPGATMFNVDTEEQGTKNASTPPALPSSSTRQDSEPGEESFFLPAAAPPGALKSGEQRPLPNAHPSHQGRRRSSTETKEGSKPNQAVLELMQEGEKESLDEDVGHINSSKVSKPPPSKDLDKSTSPTNLKEDDGFENQPLG